MAIYDISEHVDKKTKEERNAVDLSSHISNLGENKKISETHIFSSIAARLFFLMLFIADVAWGLFTFSILVFAFLGNIMTGCAFSRIKKYCFHLWLNLRRSCVCGISLVVALFSPALGTMFACTYFLMYDKKGIEEVVPSILQDQFKEFLHPF